MIMNYRNTDIFKYTMAILSVCDGAHTNDNVGFNQFDANFVRSVVSRQTISYAQIKALYKVLSRYKNQLLKMGLNYDTLVLPPQDVVDNITVFAPSKSESESIFENNSNPTYTNTTNNTKSPRVSIYESDDCIYFKSGFLNRDEFQLLLRFFKDNRGFRYNPDKKQWYISLKDKNSTVYINEIRDFKIDIITKLGFDIAPAVLQKLAILDPPKKIIDVANPNDSLLEISSKQYSNIEIKGLKRELFPFQKVAVEYSLNRKNILITDDMGLGKAQPIDSKLLTPNGWTLMGNIKVGDSVFGSDGYPHIISGVFPQGIKDVYKVTFTDGSFTECCDEHLWEVQTPLRKFRGYSSHIVQLKDIKNNLHDINNNTKFFIPITKPVQFEEKKLPISPYTFGALLGDGGFTSIGSILFTSMDIDIINRLHEEVSVLGLIIKSTGDKYGYRIITPREHGHRKNPLISIIKEFGLNKTSEYKFIPDIYKFSSVEQRLELLRGLLDTDGSIHSNVITIEYTSVSEKLCDDVKFLVQSLGGKAKKSTRITSYTYNGIKKNGKRSYRLNISFENTNPFWCKRKSIKFKPRTKYLPTRGISSVEYIGKKECQCIYVDSNDHLYLTDDCIVTHNTTESLAIVHYHNAFPALIVCPAMLKRNWDNEINFLLYDKKVQILKGEQDIILPNMDFYIINYDIIDKYADKFVEITRAKCKIPENLQQTTNGKKKKPRKQRVLSRKFLINLKSIIVDESHYIKNKK